MGQSAGAYRREIDGLRAIAVVAVMLFHAGLLGVTGGYVGVDVFFVISGYLISGIILRETRAGTFTFANFYERRIRRIFPALFVVLAVTVALSLLVLPPEQMQSMAQSAAATVGLMANLFFWHKSGYFGGDAEMFPLIHMWSLSVEEQYYLLFPVVVLLALRMRLSLAWVMGLAFAASLILCLVVTRTHPLGAFFLAPTRAWELLAGVFVAMYERPWRAALSRVRWRPGMVEAAGMSAIIAALFLFDETTAFPGPMALIPVIGTAAVILASDGTSPIGRALGSRAFVGMGLISYSAYLWHQPLYALSRVAGLTEGRGWAFWVLIALTVLLAWLTWKYVEQPFRRRGRFTLPQIGGAFAVLSAGVVAFGVAGHFALGFPGRFDASTLAVNVTAAGSPKLLECHASSANPLTPETSCRYFGEQVRWAVLGDSHGVELAYTMAERLPKGEGLLHLTYTDCEPALGFPAREAGCGEWIDRSVSYLERAPGITDVVVVFRHSYHLFGDQTKSWPRLPDESPRFMRDKSPDVARAAYVAGFTRLVERLSTAGKRVHVVRPFPELSTHIERVIFAGKTEGLSRDYYARRHAMILPVLDRLDALPGVDMIDPVPALCDDKECAAVIEGEAMYYDDDHPSLAGARRVLAFAASRP